jgi:hypothetical protein
MTVVIRDLVTDFINCHAPNSDRFHWCLDLNIACEFCIPPLPLRNDALAFHLFIPPQYNCI